jgi:hypothetical protein
MPCWRKTAIFFACFAALIAFDTNGNAIAERIPTMAITVSSSIRVNPDGYVVRNDFFGEVLMRFFKLEEE